MAARPLSADKIPYNGKEAGGCPYDKKDVAGKEYLGILSVKTGTDMHDHKYCKRDEHQSHEYGVEYFKSLVSHNLQ